MDEPVRHTQCVSPRVPELLDAGDGEAKVGKGNDIYGIGHQRRPSRAASPGPSPPVGVPAPLCSKSPGLVLIFHLSPVVLGKEILVMVQRLATPPSNHVPISRLTSVVSSSSKIPCATLRW